MVSQSSANVQDQAAAVSLKDKFEQFCASLTLDERKLFEDRLKVAAKTEEMRHDITAPVYLVINNSSHPLIVTKVDTSNGAAISNLFKDSFPKVGDIIQPGERYGFTWIEYFFGSNCDITVETEDGSGSAMTSTGMNMISGWAYACRFSKGCLACGQPGSEHPTWNGNVEIIDS